MDNDKEEKLKRQCSVRNLTIEQQAALDSYMIAGYKKPGSMNPKKTGFRSIKSNEAKRILSK